MTGRPMAARAGDDIRQHNRFAATETTQGTPGIPSATNAIKVNIGTIQRYQAETFRIAGQD